MGYAPQDSWTAAERVSTIGVDNGVIRGRLIGLMRIYDEHTQHVYGSSIGPVRRMGGEAYSFSVSFRNVDGLDRREVYLVTPDSNHLTNWDEIRRQEDEYRDWQAYCVERDAQERLEREQAAESLRSEGGGYGKGDHAYIHGAE